jgi:hypothetical protein
MSDFIKITLLHKKGFKILPKNRILEVFPPEGMAANTLANAEITLRSTRKDSTVISTDFCTETVEEIFKLLR